MAWRLPSKIPAPAYSKKTSTVSLRRSSRRKPTAWGWGWQFAGWLSRPMAEHCRYPLSRLMARHFALLCRVLADPEISAFRGKDHTEIAVQNGLHHGK